MKTPFQTPLAIIIATATAASLCAQPAPPDRPPIPLPPGAPGVPPPPGAPGVPPPPGAPGVPPPPVPPRPIPPAPNPPPIPPPRPPIPPDANVSAGGTVVTTGTITEFRPGTTFIVKETSGPITYHYGSGKVTYVTKKGRVIAEEQLEKRMRAGATVSVQYVNEDGRRVIRRVEVEED